MGFFIFGEKHDRTVAQNTGFALAGSYRDPFHGPGPSQRLVVVAYNNGEVCTLP
jgi:hypothetical protein